MSIDDNTFYMVAVVCILLMVSGLIFSSVSAAQDVPPPGICIYSADYYNNELTLGWGPTPCNYGADLMDPEQHRHIYHATARVPCGRIMMYRSPYHRIPVADTFPELCYQRRAEESN